MQTYTNPFKELLEVKLREYEKLHALWMNTSVFDCIAADEAKENKDAASVEYMTIRKAYELYNRWSTYLEAGKVNEAALEEKKLIIFTQVHQVLLSEKVVQS